MSCGKNAKTKNPKEFAAATMERIRKSVRPYKRRRDGLEEALGIMGIKKQAGSPERSVILLHTKTPNGLQRCRKKGKNFLITFISYSLRAGRSGDRIPVEARFSAPVQIGPGAHPASYTMGTGSLLGVKRPRRGVDHQPPSSAEVKERVELYFYSPSGPSWPLLG